MIKIKQKKKRRKSQSFSLISVVSIVMTGILCLGMLSSFGNASSGKMNSEKSEVIKDTSNIFGKDEIQDTVNGRDYVTAIINKELYTPENATEVVSMDFSEASSDFDEIKKNVNISAPDLALDYGTFTTENKYLEYYTDEKQSHYNDYSWFSFRCREIGATEYLDMSRFDYLVIDFDMFTNTDFFEEMHFYFHGFKNGSSLADSQPYFTVNSTNYGTYINDKLVEDTTYPLHITYIIKVVDVSYPEVYVYIDGEFFSSSLHKFMNFEIMDDIRVSFSKNHVNAGRSVCFDNIQMMTFGKGDGTYNGSISTCIDDATIKLQNVSDAVLYKPTKQDEQTN